MNIGKIAAQVALEAAAPNRPDACSPRPLRLRFGDRFGCHRLGSGRASNRANLSLRFVVPSEGRGGGGLSESVTLHLNRVPSIRCATTAL